MNYCIVGIGRHAKTRVIPSIINSKANLIATVSSQKNNFVVPNYKSLNCAIKNLPKNTIFYLCTPYFIRQKQIIFCLKNSFNVISEKPIFTELKYLNKSLFFLKHKKLFLYENLIYENTLAYQKLIKIYKNQKDKIIRINLNFLIPSFPKKTFRDRYKIDKNIVYDIGCYPISLLTKLNFNLNIFKLSFTRSKSNKNILIFNLFRKSLRIKIRIGLSSKYQNNVQFHEYKKKYLINYFFYGLSKRKTIKTKVNNQLVKKDIYNDKNSFNNLFAKDKKYYKSNMKNFDKYNDQNIRYLKKFLNLVNASN